MTLNFGIKCFTFKVIFTVERTKTGNSIRIFSQLFMSFFRDIFSRLIIGVIMKINKMVLFGLLLLAIVSLGAVSAVNLNDTAISDGILEDASDEDTGESYDYKYDVYMDSYFINGSSSEYPNEINVDIFDDDASGNISISVDDVEYYHAQSSGKVTHTLNIDKLNLSYGKHFANVFFKGNDNFKGFNITRSFEYNYYHVSIQNNQEITYEMFNVMLPEDATGTVKFTVNGKTFTEDVMGGYATLDLDDYDYGEYTVNVRYLNGNYPGFTKTVKFTKVYEYSFYAYDENIYCDEPADLYIDLPSDVSKNAYILVNGKKQSVKLDSNGNARVTLDDLPLGDNIITFKHDGDSSFPPVSCDLSVKVKPYVKVPYSTGFKNSEKVVVKLPKNATGNVVVEIDGAEFKKEVLKNGCANVSLDGLELGNHTINVSFDGNYNYLGSINHSLDVIPYVNVNQCIWVNSTDVFEFEVPDGNEGQLKVLLFDEVLVNEVSFHNSISKELPKLMFGDYKLFVSYIEENYIYNHTFDIESRWQNPNWQMNVKYFAQYIDGYDYDDDYDALITNFPDDADGYIELYVDGKYYDKFGHEDINFPLYDLSVGRHSFELKFIGDSYYSDSSFNATFELVNVLIDIPDTSSPQHYDGSFSVELSKNVKGTLTLKIDGKQVDKVKLGGYGKDFYDYDLSERGLSFGKHSYDISFKGSDSKTVRKKGSFVYNYYFEIDNGFSLFYGDANSLIWIRTPDDATGNVKITIDNKTFTKKISDQLYIDVSGYLGTHKLKVTYDGDNKYSKTSRETEFNVIGKINAVYEVKFNDTQENLSLSLPADAGGYLFVKIDGREYANVSLVNGTAEVTFDKLSVGDYGYTVEYVGGKYYVVPYKGKFTVEPKLIHNEYAFYDEDFTVSIELPEKETGNFSIKVNNKNYTQHVINGKANITLKNLPIGDYEGVSVKYVGDDYKYDENILFNIIPKVIVPDNMTYGESKYLQIIAPKDFKSTILVYNNYYSKYYSFKNGKATAKIPIMPGGMQWFTIAFLNDDINIYHNIYIDVLNATHPTILAKDASLYYQGGKTYNIQVIGPDGYPVAENELVSFKIKNNIINVKTDENGFAKLRIDKLPKTYKITAVYKNVNVTKKVTVKPILTLKTVKVKKSAKKLVLTAKLAVKLKNKKIAFKFNGKKYIAKTSRKGIAKVTIKSAILKKLKVGKKVKYSATYVKQTVKKSSKIKR